MTWFVRFRAGYSLSPNTAPRHTATLLFNAAVVKPESHRLNAFFQCIRFGVRSLLVLALALRFEGMF